MLYDCCITFTFTFHPSHLIMLALHALLFRTGSIEKSNHLKMSVFKSTVNPVILNLNLIVIVESVKFSASCCSYLTLFHRHLLDAAKSWSSGRMCSGLFANIQITTSRPRVCLTINTCCQIATYFKIQIQIGTGKEATRTASIWGMSWYSFRLNQQQKYSQLLVSLSRHTKHQILTASG